jgi:hypothetical protein
MTNARSKRVKTGDEILTDFNIRAVLHLPDFVFLKDIRGIEFENRAVVNVSETWRASLLTFDPE